MELYHKLMSCWYSFSNRKIKTEKNMVFTIESQTLYKLQILIEIQIIFFHYRTMMKGQIEIHTQKVQPIFLVRYFQLNRFGKSILSFMLLVQLV